MMHTKLVAGSALLFAAALVPLHAEVKLPSIFGDHMVLQRDAAVPVWGTAAPDEAVTVSVGSVTASTKADKDGKWMVKLGNLAASSTPVTLNVSGSNKITINDVLIGDVWVCSGQSNMAFPLGQSSTAKEEAAQPPNPMLRFFSVKLAAKFAPQSDVTGQWVLCTPADAAKFSGVGYYFGKEIAETEKVPVGLIGSNVGGTPAQAWTSLETLKSDPDLQKAYADQIEKLAVDPAATKAAYDAWLANGGQTYLTELAKWRADDYAAKQKNQPSPAKPTAPPTPEPPHEGGTQLPTVLFNGMIAPLQPFAIKGVIWYQGESNGGSPLYAKLFPDMIADWRKTWGQGDFPFLYVQLPNYSTRPTEPFSGVGGWPVNREVQLKSLEIPNTGMAITIDAGDGKNLHPPYKNIVGHRLALVARHVAYGENFDYSGPLYDSMKVDGNKIVITFKDTGTGLKIGTLPVTPPGSTPPPTDKLVGFSIAGEDEKFVWADATISGKNTVTISSDKVAAPVAVRYGWGGDPEVNLYNSADLPASPFRTDTFTGVPPKPAAAPAPAPAPAETAPASTNAPPAK